MKPSDFVVELRKMMEIHIQILQQNNSILADNLRLMKEVDELKKKNGK